MRRVTAALLLLAPPAFGADPPAPVVPVARIDAPAFVPAGQDIVVSSKGSLSTRPIKFKVKPAGTPFRVSVASDPPETFCIVGRAFTEAHPGVYRFQIQAIGGVGESFDVDTDDAEVIVEPKGPTPVVPPAPAPSPAPVTPPGPPPAPVVAPFAGPLQAMLFSQLDEPSTAQVRISRIKAELAALDCEWFVRDMTTADAQSWAVRMKDDGLLDASGVLTVPVVYVADRATGRVKATIKAPTKPDDVLSEVKKIRGGN